MSRELTEIDGLWPDGPGPVGGLAVRTRNCLWRAQLHTIAELVERSPDDLLRITNFGEGCLFEIETRLKAVGLELATPSVPTTGVGTSETLYRCIYLMGTRRYSSHRFKSFWSAERYKYDLGSHVRWAEIEVAHLTWKPTEEPDEG